MSLPTHLLPAVRLVARTGTRLAVACAALALLCGLAAASPAAALDQTLTTAGSSAIGYAAAVDGDTLVLGDPLGNGGIGAVHVFQRSGNAWTNTATLTASDGSVDDNLGVSVAIDGDSIVAGAPNVAVGAHAQQGALYKFSRAGAPQRTPTAKLTATPGAASEHLGASVDMDGDTVVGGAPGAPPGDSTGAAYTFARTGQRRARRPPR